jgi:Cd2+/Zn2+-exporting ATPase
LNLVENAGSKKAKMEQFITKFARWYTPSVVFAALALAVIPPLVIRFVLGGDASFAGWIHRALVFLVVSCPCALVISIPLGFFGGIGAASKNGILIKGSNYLEALNNVDTIVFDKTGTLTRGVFTVTAACPAAAWQKDALLEYAAYAECFSTHPIAVSSVQASETQSRALEKSRVSDFEDSPGKGIRAVVDHKAILAGKPDFLKENGCDISEGESLPPGFSPAVFTTPPSAPAFQAGTSVYIAVDGSFAGYLVIADEVKRDAAGTLAALKKLGVKKTVMLSGDTRAAAEQLGARLGLDEVAWELLPHEKVARFEALEAAKATAGKMVFVGDGINDAPVLARSDVGVAMGGLGSDAAIEAADVVLMTDEPSKLIDAIRIAKNTHAIVWQNIVFALGVKAVILVLGALGIADMWTAVFGDVGVAVIAILNAMRALKSPVPAPAAFKTR